MVNIEDVYKKFGEASEVAQLLETELGTLLLQLLGTEKNLFEEQQPDIKKKKGQAQVFLQKS